jgi:hypothetical protein
MNTTHLTPPWGTQTDREHREEPRMRLAKVRQNNHHEGPDANKERDDEQQDLPL